MRTILSYGLVLFLFISCKQEIKRNNYPNGKIEEEYFEVNGKKNGMYKSFYENGIVSSVGEFKFGQMHSDWKYYYSTGQLMSIQKYNKGRLIKIDAWNEKNEHVIKNGNGEIIIYYSNGSPKLINRFINNMLHGKQESWYENGQKESELNYNKGKIISEPKNWDENGNEIKNK
jgi:antitoxin component YwqK of YwqJK toxin-antitoxin module